MNMINPSYVLHLGPESVKSYLGLLRQNKNTDKRFTLLFKKKDG